VAATTLQISTDPDNATVLGSDGGIYTPPFVETELGELVVLVTQDLNLYVATTGNDETGDGTQALPWATPHQAMAFLSKCVLGNGVTATVHVADGLYEFTVPLNLNHPQGTQIFINGTSATGTRPTGAALNGGGVRGNTAATRSFNEAKLDAYYNTKWLFKNCIGVKCSCGGGVTIDKVLIKGDGSEGWNGAVSGNRDGGAGAGAGAACSGAINFGETVAIHGFGSTGIVAQLGGSVFGNFITVTNNNANGASIVFSANGQFTSSTFSNNNGTGILATVGSGVGVDFSYLGYNNRSGANAHTGGAITASNGFTATNNGQDGCYAYGGGTIVAANVVATDNGRNGLQAWAGGCIHADGTGSNFRRNSSSGVYAQDGGIIFCSDATSAENGGSGLHVSHGGTINARNVSTGGTTSNADTNVLVEGAGNIDYRGGNSGQLSPAANTVGNGNGYIAK
jgi:hypothetical protein